MSLYWGHCVDCGRGNGPKGIEVFDHNNKCIICTRLDNIEKALLEIEKSKKYQEEKENTDE